MSKLSNTQKQALEDVKRLGVLKYTAGLGPGRTKNGWGWGHPDLNYGYHDNTIQSLMKRELVKLRYPGSSEVVLP